MFGIDNLGKAMFATGIYAFGAGYALKAAVSLFLREWFYQGALQHNAAIVMFVAFGVLLAYFALKGLAALLDGVKVGKIEWKK